MDVEVVADARESAAGDEAIDGRRCQANLACRREVEDALAA
jgi:hypothetical protein